MDLSQSKKGKNSKMEQQNCSIAGKGKIVNPVYLEIFNFLKTGGRKLAKDIRRTHGAKSSGEIQAIREELSEVLNSTNPVIPEIKHINILANAIRKTEKQLEDSKILFHSKGLQQTREYASDLIVEAKNKYRKAKGGLPMGK